MRNRKSLTSSEPSVSVVIGIVRCMFRMPSCSVYLSTCIVQVRRWAGFAGLGRRVRIMAVTTAAE